MKQITLLEPELEVIIEALEEQRKRYSRENARRDDVLMVTAVEDVLDKLRQAATIGD